MSFSDEVFSSVVERMMKAGWIYRAYQDHEKITFDFTVEGDRVLPVFREVLERFGRDASPEELQVLIGLFLSDEGPTSAPELGKR